MMSYRALLPTAGGRLLLIAALLLLCFQLYTGIEALRQKRSAAFRLAAAAQPLIGLFLLALMLDADYLPDYLPPRTFPPVKAALYGLPWLCWAVSLALLTAAALLLLRSVRRHARERLSADSVKEAVDLLPMGICFGREDGTVALANMHMTRWCRELTGAVLSDYNAFRRAVADAGQAQNGSILVRTDERALLFTETELETDGASCRQLIAADVTALYRITEELAAKNARLRDIQLRMKAYGVEASGLVMSREILAARTTVHDEVGHVLLRARHYFEHPEDADVGALLALTRQTNDLLLREAEEPDDAAKDSLSDALSLARGIGVSVRMTGEPPEEPVPRALLARAVRECAMNAAKHAGADELTVVLTEKGGAITAEFRNNGDPPGGPIVETGGLLALRGAAEEAGGALTVREGEAFAVLLTLPPHTEETGEEIP